ncbi:MAG: hypothetical protein Q4G14_07730 [Paracoccus sp. (in: a-proteobacteria)]|uniref:hypothetical protein n=1 Tax=Paracoccus sp. TaxID=267 RepID=UPI0026DFEA37|nr:hypothetical protein [Paracoccus sp. (in: a-proteobacteria)]MDO5613116.1 hypothetical protein [Paracoccus sp. (in: a-proteobacteria)]
MIRPDLIERLRPWGESLAAMATALTCLWITRLGGWFFGALGLAGGVVALLWLIAALRRARFARAITAPGVVEIDEGAIRYYGAPVLGGEIALRDLSEIRLLTLQGAAHWRLRAQDGQALLIPVDAAGAPLLADAFATLPGIDMGTIAAALATGGDGAAPPMRTLWRRPA